MFMNALCLFCSRFALLLVVVVFVCFFANIIIYHHLLNFSKVKFHFSTVKCSVDSSLFRNLCIMLLLTPVGIAAPPIGCFSEICPYCCCRLQKPGTFFDY